MARVLITGSNGFAAKFVADELRQHRHEVIGLAKPGSDAEQPGFDGVGHIDLLDAKAVREFVAHVRPDKVVHLAAISFVAHGDASDIYLNNVVGTRNLLEALADCDGAASSALIISSANVYGAEASGQIAETAPALPANDYGLSKLACEHLARIYQERVPCTILRPFNYTGVGQSPLFLIPKIVDHIVRQEKVIELGNLDVSRDFSDVRSFAEVCRRLLDCPAAVGQVVNFCSGQAYSLGQILSMLMELSGQQISVEVNPRFVRANEVKSLWGNPTKLASLIGPLPERSLAETLQWMLSHASGNTFA